MFKIKGQWEAAMRDRDLSLLLCDDPEGCDGGGREVQDRWNACMHTADLLCRIAETNTAF